MKTSTKAALLSALVFPGTGHLYLKHFLPGVVLLGSSLAALAYIVANAVDSAMQIAEQIQRGDGPVDIAGVTELLSQHSAAADGHRLDVATIVLLVAWLFGIFDAYRVGRRHDPA